MNSDAKFLVGVISLLQEAKTTTSYKYALLRALIELSVENVGRYGAGASSITTRQVAERVLEYYWPQARIHKHTDRPLLAIQGSGSAIPDKIRAFRDKHGTIRTGSPSKARINCKVAFEKLLKSAEQTMVKYPIPRLQPPGADTLLYDWHVQSVGIGNPAFDNRIPLHKGVEAKLATYAQLLIPLIKAEWTRFMARCNQQDFADMGTFLFESMRANLTAATPGLVEIAKGRCFYCQDHLPATVHIDHFIPWSLFADDGIFNLLPTHTACNTSKGDRFASHTHLQKWTHRIESHHDEIAEVGHATKLSTDRDRTLALATSSYRQLQTTSLVWHSRGENLRHALPAEIAKVLASQHRNLEH